MSFVPRLAVFALLAFAFLAAPAGAICAACCPEFDAARKLEAAMPCCAGDCEPEVVNAKPPAPAVVAPRPVLDRPTLVLTSVTASLGPGSGESALPVFVSPSPPAASPPPISVLRL